MNLKKIILYTAVLCAFLLIAGIGSLLVLISYLPHPAELAALAAKQPREEVSKSIPENINNELSEAGPSISDQSALIQFHDDLFDPRGRTVNVCEKLETAKPLDYGSVDIVEQVYESIRTQSEVDAVAEAYLSVVRYFMTETSGRDLMHMVWSSVRRALDGELPNSSPSFFDKAGFYLQLATFAAEVSTHLEELNRAVERARLLTVLAVTAGHSPEFASDAKVFHFCRDLQRLSNDNDYVTENDELSRELQSLLETHSIDETFLEKMNLAKPFKAASSLEKIEWGWLENYAFE